MPVSAPALVADSDVKGRLPSKFGQPHYHSTVVLAIFESTHCARRVIDCSPPLAPSTPAVNPQSFADPGPASARSGGRYCENCPRLRRESRLFAILRLMRVSLRMAASSHCL